MSLRLLRLVDRPVGRPVVGAEVALVHRLLPAHRLGAALERHALGRMAGDPVEDVANICVERRPMFSSA